MWRIVGSISYFYGFGKGKEANEIDYLIMELIFFFIFRIKFGIYECQCNKKINLK